MISLVETPISDGLKCFVVFGIAFKGIMPIIAINLIYYII